MNLSRHALITAGGALLAAGASLFAIGQTVNPVNSGLNMGSANVCPKGQTTPAPCSQTGTVTFKFTAGGTIGKPVVLMMGAPNLDFTDGGTGTCTTNGTGHIYSSNDTCTVDVKLAPMYPGQRKGAVMLYDNASPANALATAFVNGTGTGPQVVFDPPKLSRLGGGFGNIVSVAVDASGSVYVGDFIVGTVKKMPAGCASSACVKKLVVGGFEYIINLAVDGAGNVYFVTDEAAVGMIPAGCASPACVTTLIDRVQGGFGGLFGGSALAADGSGNIYVSQPGAMKKIPAGCASSACVTTLFGGSPGGSGLAVDGSGNIYVSSGSGLAMDWLGNTYVTSPGAVTEIPAGCASSECMRTLGGGGIGGYGVAVDGAGTLYLTDFDGLKEMKAGCSSASCVINLGTNPPGEYKVAVDGSGNIYVAGFTFPHGVPSLTEYHRASPPALTFAKTAAGSASTDSPQTVTIANNGNQDLDILSLSYGKDFPEAAGVSTDCDESTTLAAGESCTLSIRFSPLATSLTSASTPLSELISLTDNNLNGNAVGQSIVVNGTATPVLPALTSPTAGSTLRGSTATFRWSKAGIPTDYALKLGTTHFGASDVFRGITSASSIVVSGIPTNGAKLYAQLEYKFNGTWTPINYTFTEAPWDPPAIITPAPGSTLTGSSVTFNWSAGAGPTAYRLRMGTAGVGSSDVYLGNTVTSLSAAVSGIPTNGQPVYVTLGYKVNGVWHAVPYTYTAH